MSKLWKVGLQDRSPGRCFTPYTGENLVLNHSYPENMNLTQGAKYAWGLFGSEYFMISDILDVIFMNWAKCLHVLLLFVHLLCVHEQCILYMYLLNPCTDRALVPNLSVSVTSYFYICTYYMKTFFYIFLFQFFL